MLLRYKIVTKIPVIKLTDRRLSRIVLLMVAALPGLVPDFFKRPSAGLISFRPCNRAIGSHLALSPSIFLLPINRQPESILLRLSEDRGHANVNPARHHPPPRDPLKKRV